MAWSWSHTQEAYSAAEHNLRQLDSETLRIIFAEWRAAQNRRGIVEDCNAFNERKYNRALRYAQTLPDDILADFIWEKASENATCDNGGWNAWLCPSGCHTVPFDTDDDLEEC